MPQQRTAFCINLDDVLLSNCLTGAKVNSIPLQKILSTRRTETLRTVYTF